jgi:hypothetical protein
LPPSAQAETLKGRVVDSAGRPVTGANVRIWQKLPAPGGRGLADQPIRFGDGDVLHTDVEGRYASPDVLAPAAFARISVEAEGMLGEQSEWIEIDKGAAAVAPDIQLKGLRTVAGQVLDRRGCPVVGATVFNSGDGRERVETRSDGAGQFRLAGVPQGPIFLFAEKSGYRFAGIRLPPGEAAEFTLAAITEAVQPLATLPPLLSPDEENALARETIAPWLDIVERAGTESEKMWALRSMAELDPLEAFNRARAMEISKPTWQTFIKMHIVNNCLRRPGSLAWDELETMIEAGEDPMWMPSISLLRRSGWAKARSRAAASAWPSRCYTLGALSTPRVGRERCFQWLLACRGPAMNQRR